MPFERAIIDKNEVIKEGTTRNFSLTTYHQETKTDEPARYRKLFVDYSVLFKGGVITVSMKFVDIVKILQTIELGITENVIQIENTSNEKLYYLNGNRFYFITDDPTIKSWYMEFETDIENVFLSNKYCGILDMRLYVEIADRKIEISNMYNQLTVVEQQPLIEDKIEYKTEWGRKLIRLAYNKKSSTKIICKNCV